jgi:COP9 signalosome complex subunit 7
MEQTKALNALEPFLALSKSATSPRAASDLVVQATSAPNTYVFAELLQTPNIQNLRNSEEHAQYLTLLEIFAWGTWADYKGTFTTTTTTTSFEFILIDF